MSEWKCPICGFSAGTDEQKDSHMKQMTDTPHQELLKEKGKNALNDMGNKVKDAVDDVKQAVS